MGCCSDKEKPQTQQCVHHPKDLHQQPQNQPSSLHPIQTKKPHPPQRLVIRQDKQHLIGKQQQRTNFQTMSEFLQGIRDEIKLNKSVYGEFLNVEQILKILHLFEQQFIDHEFATDLISVVIDFLSFCKNESNFQPRLPTTFTQNYPQELAIRWQKIRDPNYMLNKAHLRILDFIVRKPEGDKKQYGMCFQDVKLQLSQEMSSKMAAVANQMAREHNKSFCFLSNYLYGSCLQLSNHGVPIQEIQQRYTQILQNLCEKYRPAPQIERNKEVLDFHQSFIRNELKPKLFIDLRGKDNKESIVDSFIMERANQAKAQFNRFYKLIKAICQNNDGYRFKANVKIKDITENKALIRIKEKIFARIYEQEKQNKQFEQLRQTARRTCQTQKSLRLEDFVAEEKKAYEIKIKSIYQGIQQPIPFLVSDMLRGKCMFATVQNINKCCQEIKQALQLQENKDLKLIEIDNRLRKGTSDLVLKILFGDVIAEMQLVINLSSAEYEFSHKLYQLKRSKFFTLLTQLWIVNEGVTRQYFQQAKAVIAANISGEGCSYDQVTTFKVVSQNLPAFVKQLPIKLELNAENTYRIDMLMMSNQVAKFQNLIKNVQKQKKHEKPGYQTKYMQGKYFCAISEYSKSLEKLGQATRQIETIIAQHRFSNLPQMQMIKANMLLTKAKVYHNQSNYREANKAYFYCLEIQQKVKGKESLETAITLDSIGTVYKDQGKYPKALKYYEMSQTIKGKTSRDQALTLNNIGSAYKEQGKYKQALQCFLKCLSIQQKPSQQLYKPLTLNNIGSLYKQQGNYPKALEYYSQSLQIQQNLKGKGSIDTALTLNNIGALYKEQGNYKKALQHYFQALTIQQKVKGKGSIQTAPTINNIGIVYSSQGRLPQALIEHSKSLQIQEKFKGKNNIDSASTLNYIGTVYVNQGNADKGLQFFVKALQIQERVKGKDSIDKAQTLKNIGMVYMSKSNYPKVLEYYQQSLKLQQDIKGNSCIDKALTLNLIGMVQTVKGNNAKATDYYSQALEIQIKVKGNGSIDTASTLCNIGMIYLDKGNYPKAIEFYMQALTIQQKIKGKGCIDTALTFMSLGSVYASMGKQQKALDYFAQALQIQQNILGKDAVSNSITLSNIGTIYMSQAKYDKALECFSKSMEILQLFKGPGNIDTALVLSNIGNVYMNQGMYQKSLQYFFRAFEIQQSVKGKGCIDTALTLNNIATVYLAQGINKKALDYYSQSLKIQQNVKGKGSIDTALTLNNIGNIYMRQGNFKVALENFSQSLSIQQAVKGKGSIDTALTYTNLGTLYSYMGNDERAIQYFNIVLQIQENIKGKGCIDTALTFNNIGSLYLKKGQLQKAQQLLVLSLKTFENASSAKPPALYLLTLAACYLQLNEEEKLEELMEKYSLDLP